ncbi:hypothetical protein C8J56DRAFT_1041975 [Mycena floridula]|nr:hypothetical protein C8J56DRAFT_1041975 [Mycena floridula]
MERRCQHDEGFEQVQHYTHRPPLYSAQAAECYMRQAIVSYSLATRILDLLDSFIAVGDGVVIGGKRIFQQLMIGPIHIRTGDIVVLDNSSTPSTSYYRREPWIGMKFMQFKHVVLSERCKEFSEMIHGWSCLRQSDFKSIGVLYRLTPTNIMNGVSNDLPAAPSWYQFTFDPENFPIPVESVVPVADIQKRYYPDLGFHLQVLTGLERRRLKIWILLVIVVKEPHLRVWMSRRGWQNPITKIFSTLPGVKRIRR